MGPWPSKIIPLNTGSNDFDAKDSAFQGITESVNCDFSEKGAVKPRASFASTGLFGAQRVNAALDGYSSIGGTWTSLASTGYTALCTATARSFGSEYPVLLCHGRTFSYDGTIWSDRLGATPFRVDRQTATTRGLCGGSQLYAAPGVPPDYPVAPAPTDERDIPVIAHNFGYDARANTKEVVLVDEVGGSGTKYQTTYGTGAGTSARCGRIYGSLHVERSGSANLVYTYRDDFTGSVTQVVLASNAKLPTSRGNNPVMCCDQDSASFFAVYLTTGNAIVVLKFSTAGVLQAGSPVTVTTIGGEGATVNGIWITNSTVAADKICIAYVASTFIGCATNIRSMSTLGTSGIDLTMSATLGMGGWGPVVCGAAVGGEVWVAWVTTDGDLTVRRRSLTAATSYFVWGLSGRYRPSVVSTEEAVSWYIQHQPLWFNGRVLMAVCFEPANDYRNYNANACTWIELDLTDIANSTNANTNFTRFGPGIVARGPSEGSCEAWNPFAAILDDNTSGSTTYAEFGSVDWEVFAPSLAPAAKTGLINSSQVTEFTGFSGALGLNRIYVLKPQYASCGETTVIAGSVPHGIARGNAHEIGWVENRPVFHLETQIPGSLVAGRYAVRVCWKYTDAAGQVHRSEPGLYASRTIVGGAGTKSIDVWFWWPQLTEKDYLQIEAEVYMTDKDPTGVSAYYLQKTLKMASGATQEMVNVDIFDPKGASLYTDGGVFANEFAGADGGVVTLGQRCWVSDGTKVHGSKLLGAGDPPQWYVSGSLSLTIPPAAGRVIGLAAMDEKLVMFCERGVFISVGDGPDNTGAGTDFLVPQRISHMGLSQQRALASTPGGIFFCASNSRQDQNALDTVGSLYVVNPGFSVAAAGQRIQRVLNGAPIIDIVFSPERDLLVIQPDESTSDGTGCYVLDLRANQVTNWQSTVDPQVNKYCWWTSARGILYASTLTEVLRMDGTRGTDSSATSGSLISYPMSVTVDGITPGDDNLVLGRIRAIRPLGYCDQGDYHNLAATVILDEQSNPVQWIQFTVALPTTDTDTRPTSRYCPEFRLTTQKCSTMKVILSIDKSTATLTGLEIQFKPINRAVSASRS